LDHAADHFFVAPIRTRRGCAYLTGCSVSVQILDSLND
jgi:hypothetical protein